MTTTICRGLGVAPLPVRSEIVRSDGVRPVAAAMGGPQRRSAGAVSRSGSAAHARGALGFSVRAGSRGKPFRRAVLRAQAVEEMTLDMDGGDGGDIGGSGGDGSGDGDEGGEAAPEPPKGFIAAYGPPCAPPGKCLPLAPHSYHSRDRQRPSSLLPPLWGVPPVPALGNFPRVLP